MRKPLLATKSVTLVHCIRQGTGSTSYTTVLSGVSCREVAAAGTGAQSGAGSGFAPKSSSEICIFRATPQQPRRARQNRRWTQQAPFSTLPPSRPQTKPQGPVTGRWPRRTR